MEMMDHDDRRNEADEATARRSDNIKRDQNKSESGRCCCRESAMILMLVAICDMTYYD